MPSCAATVIRQAEELRHPCRTNQLRRLLPAEPLARMFAQRVRDFVADHHADFVVVQTQLVDAARCTRRSCRPAGTTCGSSGDLTTLISHFQFFARSFHLSAKGISRFAISRTRFTSGLSSGSRRLVVLGIVDDLRVFLGGLRFERRRADQVAKQRRIAEADLIVLCGLWRRYGGGVVCSVAGLARTKARATPMSMRKPRREA